MTTGESTNPKGVCEKLFDAISVTPAYRSVRRISHHPQDPASHGAPTAPPSSAHGTPTPPSSAPSNADTNRTQITHVSPGKPEKSMAPSEKTQKEKVSRLIDLAPTPHKKVPEAVPTKADPPPPKMRAQKEKPTTASAKAGREIAITQAPGSEPTDGKPKSKMNATVKAVVQHGKEAAAKVHLPRGGKPEQEKVEPAEKGKLSNINDKASDYIARAKYKIRATTTLLGGGYDGSHHGKTGHDKE